MTTRKPVLFLDVDGVLIRYTRTEALPTPHVKEFLEWAVEHFECRWLTSWAKSGTMDWEHRVELAKKLGVSEALLRNMDHRHPWNDEKTQAIDITEFDDNHCLVRWLDDDRMNDEQATLKRWGVQEIFIHTDCNKNPQRLKQVWDELQTLLKEHGH
jgi:hypothetical protein